MMTTTISSHIIGTAHQLRGLLSASVEQSERCSMLSKLVFGALQDLDKKMPEGVSPIELMLAADIIASWAVSELAQSSRVDPQVMQQSWVYAQAMRCELLPSLPPPTKDFYVVKPTN